MRKTQFPDYKVVARSIVPRSARGLTATVPCNGCTRCCEQVGSGVGLTPDELPKFPSAVNGMLPPKADGSCPMLIGGKCSIYSHRPHSCRTFDCRVFIAAGISPPQDPDLFQYLGEHKWEPPAATEENRLRQGAVAFLRKEVLPRWFPNFDHVVSAYSEVTLTLCNAIVVGADMMAEGKVKGEDQGQTSKKVRELFKRAAQSLQGAGAETLSPQAASWHLPADGHHARHK